MIKKRNKVGILVLCLFTLHFIKPATVHATEDAIIAVVNDELITLRDLKEYIRSTFISLAANGLPEDQLKKAMLELETNGIKKLIEDKIILSRANEIGLTISDKMLEERLETVKAKYPNEQAFMESLIQYGVTINDIKDKIIDQLKIKYIINHEVRSKIFINPKEVNRYYNQNIGQYALPEKLELDSIFLTMSDNKEQTIEKAKEAYAKILSGEAFLAVAQEYSQTPTIGTIQKGQLLPSVEDEIFTLNEGDISSIITVDSGVYIFKINKKLFSRTAPLNEVSESIKNIIFQEKFQKRFNKWLTKLKKDAYIEIKK